MRAIFIDAVNRKVEEVQIENELKAFLPHTEKLNVPWYFAFGKFNSSVIIADSVTRLANSCN